MNRLRNGKMDTNDINQIEDILSNKYVNQKECEKKHKDIEKKLTEDDKRITLILHDFDIIKKLMWAIATSSISAAIISIFQLLFK